MEYIQLGNSDLTVSKICLGCMGFGEANSGMHTWTLDYEQSKAIIAYSLEKGVNFFDTAMDTLLEQVKFLLEEHLKN